MITLDRIGSLRWLAIAGFFLFRPLRLDPGTTLNNTYASSARRRSVYAAVAALAISLFAAAHAWAGAVIVEGIGTVDTSTLICGDDFCHQNQTSCGCDHFARFELITNTGLPPSATVDCLLCQNLSPVDNSVLS